MTPCCALPSKAIIAVVCIVLAYFGYYVVTSMIYKWGNSFVLAACDADPWKTVETAPAELPVPARYLASVYEMRQDVDVERAVVFILFFKNEVDRKSSFVFNTPLTLDHRKQIFKASIGYV